jgi:hypothetical protein
MTAASGNLGLQTNLPVVINQCIACGDVTQQRTLHLQCMSNQWHAACRQQETQTLFVFSVWAKQPATANTKAQGTFVTATY